MKTVRSSCEKIRTWDIILTTFVVAFALFFAILQPIHSSAEGEGGSYESWVRNTTGYQVYESDIDGRLESSASGKAYNASKEKDPSVFTEMVSEAIAGIGTSLDEALRNGNGGIDASTTGVIMGTVIAGAPSVFVFDLVKGNIFGIAGSYIYTATRAVVIVLIVILATWGVAKSVWTSDAVAFRAVKEALVSGLLALVLIYVMPLIVDWSCAARDFVSVEMYETLTNGIQPVAGGEEGDGNSTAVAQALDLPSHYKERYDKSPTIVNSLVYLCVCIIPLAYVWNYLKIAVQETILFGTFPVFALAGVTDKGTRTRWLAVMITNLFIPAIDLALILIPTYIMEYFFLNTDYYEADVNYKTLWDGSLWEGAVTEGSVTVGKVELVEGAPLLKAIMMCALFVSVIPARNMILQLFGNAFGISQGRGALGGALAMGAAAVKSVGSMFNGKENPGGSKSDGSSESGSAKDSNREAETHLGDMQRKLDNVGSAPDDMMAKQSEIKDVPPAENQEGAENANVKSSEISELEDGIKGGEDIHTEHMQDALNDSDTVDMGPTSETEPVSPADDTSGEQPDIAPVTDTSSSESADIDSAEKADGGANQGDNSDSGTGGASAPALDEVSGTNNAEKQGPLDEQHVDVSPAKGDGVQVEGVGSAESADSDNTPDALAMANAAIADATVKDSDLENASSTSALSSGGNEDKGDAKSGEQDNPLAALDKSITDRFNDEKTPILGSTLGGIGAVSYTDQKKENEFNVKTARARMGNLQTIDNLKEKQNGFVGRTAALESVISKAESSNMRLEKNRGDAAQKASAYTNLGQARANLEKVETNIATAKSKAADKGRVFTMSPALQNDYNAAMKSVESAAERVVRHEGGSVTVEAVKNMSEEAIKQRSVDYSKAAENYQKSIDTNKEKIFNAKTEIQANQTASKIVNNEINRRMQIEKDFANNNAIRGMEKQVFSSADAMKRQLTYDARVMKAMTWEKIAEKDIQGKMTPLERREAQRAIQKREAYASVGKAAVKAVGQTALKGAVGAAAITAGVGAGAVASMVASVGGEDAMRSVGESVSGFVGGGTSDVLKAGADVGKTGIKAAWDAAGDGIHAWQESHASQDGEGTAKKSVAKKKSQRQGS